MNADYGLRWIIFACRSTDASPSVGTYKGEISLAHRNLLGFGDTLTVDLGFTEGAADYGAGYTFPVAVDDTTVSLYYRRNEDSVVEEQFRALDITSSSQTAGIRLRHPFLRTVADDFSVALAGEYRTSSSKLLGRDFSFSPGEQDGRERISVLRLSQEYVHRNNRTLLAAASTLNYGISLLGSTLNHDAPDSRFFTWLGQAMLLNRVADTPAQFMVRASAQLAANQLLPLEKFGLGGMNSVRGYRRNILVRDNGVNGSLELRIPVGNDSRSWGALQLVPFFDVGWGWNTGAATPSPRTIESVGAGFRWNLRDRLLLEFYYGYGLERISVDNRTLSDQGVHFLVTAEVF